MSIDEMTTFCIEACDHLGHPMSNLKVIEDHNPRIASFMIVPKSIKVDPNVTKYLSEADLRTILLHEVCHAVEYLQAKENSDIGELSYEREYRKTKGHNRAFKKFAERASNELNDGVNVFNVPEFFCDVEPDDRVRLLCDALNFDVEKVHGCIGYFDISMNDDEKVLVRPDVLDGSNLDSDSFRDIADTIACAQGANSDAAFDKAVDIAYKVWADWAQEGE